MPHYRKLKVEDRDFSFVIGTSHVKVRDEKTGKCYFLGRMELNGERDHSPEEITPSMIVEWIRNSVLFLPHSKAKSVISDDSVTNEKPIQSKDHREIFFLTLQTGEYEDRREEILGIYDDLALLIEDEKKVKEELIPTLKKHQAPYLYRAKAVLNKLDTFSRSFVNRADEGSNF